MNNNPITLSNSDNNATDYNELHKHSQHFNSHNNIPPTNFGSSSNISSSSGQNNNMQYHSQFSSQQKTSSGTTYSNMPPPSGKTSQSYGTNPNITMSPYSNAVPSITPLSNNHSSYYSMPPPPLCNPPTYINMPPPPCNPPLQTNMPPPLSMPPTYSNMNPLSNIPPPLSNPPSSYIPPPTNPPSYPNMPPPSNAIAANRTSLSIVPPSGFPFPVSSDNSRPPINPNNNYINSLTPPVNHSQLSNNYLHSSNSNPNLITISTASPPPTPVTHHHPGELPQPQFNYSKQPQTFPNILSVPPPPLSLSNPPRLPLPSNVPSIPSTPVSSSPGGTKSLSRKGSSRIDPSQMPRPPFTNIGDLDIQTLELINYPTRSGTGRKNPPSCNAPYSAIDTGNATPRHVRISLVAPPISQDLCNNVVGLPLSMCATPFAAAELDEDPICAVPCDTDPPPRCSRCKGYINPSVTWVDAGNKWECNLCFMSNPVTSNYYSPLDNAGLRVDRMSRAELQLGSYDLLVNQDYCVRPPQAPVLVFAIDCCLRAHVSGITAASIKAVASAIKQLRGIFNSSPVNTPRGMCKISPKRLSLDTGAYFPQDNSSILYDDIRIGIFTFSGRQMQFYHMDAGSNNDLKILVTDADDPYCPLPEQQLLISLQSPVLDLLIDRLPSVIVNPLNVKDNYLDDSVLLNESMDGRGDSCPTAAIKAMQEGLVKVGGRLYIMTSTHSTNGYGKVSGQRETPFSMYGQADKEFSMYCSPSVAKKDELSELYNTLAADCLLSNLCVNIFMCGVETDSPHFPETTLISESAVRTGGKLFFMTGSFTLEDNVNRLEQQLLHDIDSMAGCEVVIKVRTGVGIRVDSYIGPGSFSDLRGEIEMCGISKDTSMLFTFKYDSTLKDEDKVHFQLAVLYTTPFFKQRAIRIHNMALVASVKPSTIFRNTDIEAVTVTLMKQAVHRALHYPMAADDKNNPKTHLNKTVIDTLLKYRINCSANSPKGQLILPESLKVLPIYALGMIKHYSLVENRPPNPGTPSRATNNGNSFSQSGKSLSSASSVNRNVIDNILPKITVRGNQRAHELRRMLSLGIKEIINSIYPKMYSILKLCGNDLLENESEYGDYSDGSLNSTPQVSPMEKTNKQFLFGSKGYDSPVKNSNDCNPPALNGRKRKQLFQLLSSLNPSSEVFESDQIYLLDDRTNIWIYVGRSVPQATIEDVFNIDSGRPYERNEFTSINQTTHTGKRVLEFIDLLRNSSVYKQEIKVIWAEQSGSSPLLNRFSIRLVEDRFMSYVDFLCNMHTMIQEKIPQ